MPPPADFHSPPFSSPAHIIAPAPSMGDGPVVMEAEPCVADGDVMSLPVPVLLLLVLLPLSASAPPPLRRRIKSLAAMIIDRRRKSDSNKGTYPCRCCFPCLFLPWPVWVLVWVCGVGGRVITQTIDSVHMRFGGGGGQHSTACKLNITTTGKIGKRGNSRRSQETCKGSAQKGGGREAGAGAGACT